MEEAKRKTRKVESKQQVFVIGVTNETLDKLPDALASRFYCRELLPCATIPKKELVKLLAQPANKEAQEAFAQGLRQVQALAAQVFSRIYVDMMPPVEMSKAYEALGEVQAYLKRFGYDILPRDMIRCLLLAKSLAVWSVVEAGVMPLEVRCTKEMALFK